MTSVEDSFRALLESDVQFGYLDGTHRAARQFHPEVVVNSGAGSMLRVLRHELRHCERFSFSVAFISPQAIALLKQDFIEFSGQGRIITSDYLGFNSPQAFAELCNLGKLGIQARLHSASAYHPKAYVFGYSDRITAVLGSSNLTAGALVSNHEWNLKVTAALDSDLAAQLSRLIDEEARDSVAITSDWIDEYTTRYRARPAPVAFRSEDAEPIRGDEALDPWSWDRARESITVQPEVLDPSPDSTSSIELAGTASPRAVPELVVESKVYANSMQREALARIAEARAQGARRALVISATGTGKTILSALDVRAVAPRRMLFVVHREQIIDKAIQEFRRVLDAPASDFGKFVGGTRQGDRRYVFATVQTLSKPEALAALDPHTFDYILVDEVHRVGAASYTKVLEHFQPEFLLGMTATPERSDGFNVYELFDYNVPYEIRLNRALEEGMLSPFHYYGVTDVTFEDGSSITAEADPSALVSPVRITHVLNALDTYGQAGVKPRGLIFCSRVEEAGALARELNGTEWRGRKLKVVALSGMHSVPEREQAVQALEEGELDYVVTVDVFNEGVDIPSVNQVVMLRQTQSAIVFVQQLGRGLRKTPNKDYVVVIDFIGNYVNNYLIPIALFGDASLNTESLRKNLFEASEAGVVAGLSSVRFDRIAEQRVLDAVTNSRLDSLRNLKEAFETLQYRLGGPPDLYDFWRFQAVDPVVMGTAAKNYFTLRSKWLRMENPLSETEDRALTLLSFEVLAAKRSHEAVAVSRLLAVDAMTAEQLHREFDEAGLLSSRAHVESVWRVLSLEFHTKQDKQKYGTGIIVREGARVSLHPDFRRSYEANSAFRLAVDDLVKTANALTRARFDPRLALTPGLQHTKKDACRQLLWSSDQKGVIYGYKRDELSKTCAIFVRLHKPDDVAASVAYEDEILDRRTMRWFTKNDRTLDSPDVRPIVDGSLALHVFVQRDGAEGSLYYYLGRASAHDAFETTMPGTGKESHDVVQMNLVFDHPIDSGVYDYFHPTVTV